MDTLDFLPVQEDSKPLSNNNARVIKKKRTKSKSKTKKKASTISRKRAPTIDTQISEFVDSKPPRLLERIAAFFLS